MPAEFPVQVPQGPAGALAPHTCVGFWPADPARAPTVFLDPGHGGRDPGTVSSPSGGLAEKELTLAISLDVRDLLVRAGYTVVMSRIADTNVAAIEPGDLSEGVETPQYVRRDLLARNECADASDAGALVGIYIDGNTDPATAGSETLYCDERPFAAANLRLATLVEDDVVASVRQSGFDLSSRGVFPDDQGFGVALTQTAAAYNHLMLLGPASQPENPSPTMMPGALIEPIFLTNPPEAAYGAAAAGQRAIAAGVAQAVETFLPLPHPHRGASSPRASGKKRRT